ncbi:Early nodulin-like protein 1 [Senna tora]|uniref:Early nodulin-like protein 1 n=1 Tax=Senna tora TaxID=362788 RepID=A0A834WKP6_9FABA|nr:Early nodulin-like protein 1 [Senna tora]
MAQTILRACALGFLCVLVLVQKGSAYEFVVGGQKGWSVPSDPNTNPYNQWAEKSRFQIGDSLVFNYQSGQDSVLQVKSEDYGNCNTNAPIAKFSDGHTVIKFSQSGSHFFISVAPSTPPAGSVQPNPTPSPSAEPSHPNNNAASSSVFVSFAGSVGAIFMASALSLSL